MNYFSDNRKYVILISLVASFVIGCSRNSTALRSRVLETQGTDVLSRERVISLSSNSLIPTESPYEVLTPGIGSRWLVVPKVQWGLEGWNLDTWRPRWKFRMKHGVAGRPLLTEDTVFVGGADGEFYALDLETGQKKWSYLTRSPVYSEATYHSGHIYFVSSDDTVYCLEANTGRWVWHRKRSVKAASGTIYGNTKPLVLPGSDRLIIGTHDGFAQALDLESGSVLWETKVSLELKFPDVDSDPVIFKNLILTQSYDGRVVALKSDSGDIAWAHGSGDFGGNRAITVDQELNRIYVPSSLSKIVALDGTKGDQVWSFDLGEGKTPTNIILKDSYLVVGASQQYLYVLNKNDSHLIKRFDLGSRGGLAGTLISDKNRIYAISTFGTLYSFLFH